MAYGIATLLAYLIGSISSAIIVSKLLHLPDPRKEGSGNPGATNVLRLGGKKAAIATLLGDALKGIIPVLLAKAYGLDSTGVSLVILATFLGHLYPIYFRFQGGKGVATAFGCFLALSWPLGLSLLATWILIAACFRYSSLAALMTALFAPFYTWYFAGVHYVAIICIVSLLLIYRHKKNILKLVKGEEQKI